jgi:uncharacterized protein
VPILVAVVALVVEVQVIPGRLMAMAITSVKMINGRWTMDNCLSLSRAICVVLLLSCFHLTFAQKPVPELWSQRVHDEAKVLSASVVDQLELQLKQYEDSTSNQIAILIISSLDGDVLEDYSLRVAEKWQLGSKKNDNGVLLLIVVNDHKMRIEVGQGLEGVLTDAHSNRIIRNEMAPNFRRGDYDSGVKGAVNSMIKAIGGEYSAEDPVEENTLLGRVIFGLFASLILGVFTYITITAEGCAGWIVYLFLLPFYGVFPGAFLGQTGGFIAMGIYAIAVPILKLTRNATPGKGKKKGKGGSSGSSWWSGGGLSSGGWSSGGSGGFSGGGGSFGGGGSSGSW